MKTLIFYSKAGGGHQKAAELIASGLTTTGVEVKVKNGFDLDDSGGFDFAPFAYRLLMGPLYFLWLIIVSLQRSFAGFFLLEISYQIGKLFLYGKFEKLILEYKPQSVVSTYYFFAKLAREISQKHQLNIKITTVVTDPFSPEKVWFTDSDGDYLVYTKQAQDLALSYGLKSSHLKVIGPVVDLEPVNKANLEAIKYQLNFDFEKPTLLILGGGDGLQKGAEILKAVLITKPGLQTIVVCGRNQKLFDDCQLLINSFEAGSTVKLFKFVDFVSELISISSVVVSKAGPGVVFEVLNRSKPLILCEYIWPQELGIVTFVESNKLGTFKPKVDELIEEIDHILSGKKTLQIFNPNRLGFNLDSGLSNCLKELI
jgi:UDP-N-acetylglucosamine:LPS N-acetylglucosamine transferase